MSFKSQILTFSYSGTSPLTKTAHPHIQQIRFTLHCLPSLRAISRRLSQVSAVIGHSLPSGLLHLDSPQMLTLLRPSCLNLNNLESPARSRETGTTLLCCTAFIATNSSQEDARWLQPFRPCCHLLLWYNLSLAPIIEFIFPKYLYYL